MTASQLVTVWEDYPRDECYTLFRNFNTDPEQPEVDEQVSITFDKLTNYANDYDAWDPLYTLSPEGTDLTLTITGDIDDQKTKTMSANTDTGYRAGSMSWTPTQPGSYLLELQGNAAS